MTANQNQALIERIDKCMEMPIEGGFWPALNEARGIMKDLRAALESNDWRCPDCGRTVPSNEVAVHSMVCSHEISAGSAALEGEGAPTHAAMELLADLIDEITYDYTDSAGNAVNPKWAEYITLYTNLPKSSPSPDAQAMREALEFYANPISWGIGEKRHDDFQIGLPKAHLDNGIIARKALASAPAENAPGVVDYINGLIAEWEFAGHEGWESWDTPDKLPPPPLGLKWSYAVNRVGVIDDLDLELDTAALSPFTGAEGK